MKEGARVLATLLLVAGTSSVVGAASAIRVPGGRSPSLPTIGDASTGDIIHLYKSATSRATYPVRTAIRDSLTFQRMWHEIVGASPTSPHVDFTKYQVIIVAMGSEGSTGHRISFLSFDSAATPGLRVRTELAAPGTGCIVGGAFTSPVDIVRIPSISRIVFFADTLIANDC